MSKGGSLALIAFALAAVAPSRSQASCKRLEDCPILKALAATTGGRANSLPGDSNALVRAGRGVGSIALAPLEIPATVLRVSRSSNIVTGLVGGTIQGTLYAASRATAGALDIVTAPIPGATLPLYTRPLGQPSSSSPLQGGFIRSAR